jgi:hypothetical protein
MVANDCAHPTLLKTQLLKTPAPRAHGASLFKLVESGFSNQIRVKLAHRLGIEIAEHLILLSLGAASTMRRNCSSELAAALSEEQENPISNKNPIIDNADLKPKRMGTSSIGDD